MIKNMIIISAILLSGIMYGMNNRNVVLPIQLVVQEMMIIAAINNNADVAPQQKKVVFNPIKQKPAYRNNFSPKKKHIIHQPSNARR